MSKLESCSNSNSQRRQHSSLSDAPNPRFHHRPLDLSESTVRVFSIGYENDGISLRLWHQPLYHGQIALSYLWGDPSPTHEILINERPFLVRQNLYDFLQEMKSRPPPRFAAEITYPRHRFWVDAICIDQTNDREKNHQVRQMGRMYTQASRVIFWLGCGLLMPAPLSSISLRRPQDLQKLGSLLPPIIKLPYWRRTWVAQEIILGKDRAKVMLGSDVVSMETFGELVKHFFRSGEENLNPNGRYAQQKPYSRGWDNGAHVLALISDEPGKSWTEMTSPPRDGLVEHWFTTLIRLLGVFKGTECADQRDRLFVPLMLIGSAEAIHFVDYSKTEMTLYLDLLNAYHHWRTRGEGTNFRPIFFYDFISAETAIRSTLKVDLKQFPAFDMQGSLRCAIQVADLQRCKSLQSQTLSKLWTISLLLETLGCLSEGVTGHSLRLCASKVAPADGSGEALPQLQSFSVVECLSCQKLPVFLPTKRVAVFLAHDEYQRQLHDNCARFVVVEGWSEICYLAHISHLGASELQCLCTLTGFDPHGLHRVFLDWRRMPQTGSIQESTLLMQYQCVANTSGLLALSQALENKKAKYPS